MSHILLVQMAYCQTKGTFQKSELADQTGHFVAFAVNTILEWTDLAG